LDYSFNVSNSLAKSFYERHGAKVLENCFEKQENTRGKKVMTTKHCLRYFLGECPKEKKQAEPERRIKEPLYLVYGGRKYRVSFDCQKCVMEIWNQD